MRISHVRDSRKQMLAARSQMLSSLMAHPDATGSMQLRAIANLQSLADQSQAVQRLQTLAPSQHAQHGAGQVKGRAKPAVQLLEIERREEAGQEAYIDLTKAPVRKTESPKAASQGSDVVNLSSPLLPVQRVAFGNPIQFELIKNTRKNRQLNAKLVRWYHAAEDDARATLRNNPRPWSAAVLEQAIDYYYEAARYREDSADLHKVNDEGHLNAIDFCYNQASFLEGLLARKNRR